MFDIRYQDANNNSQDNFVWQNSWGLSTRSIGVMIMVHSDNKGLVIPPKIAITQIVVVTKEDNIEDKDGFEEYMNTIGNLLKQYRIEFDRTNETIGRKFNKWEKLGVPIRVEIGKKEFENNIVTIFRRDEMKRYQQKIYDLGTINKIFTEIENNMYNKAKQKLEMHLIENDKWDEFEKNIKNKAVLVPWCGNNICEKEICDLIKQKNNFSIKTLCIPFNSKHVIENKKCIKCQNESKKNVYFGRSF